MFILGRAHAYQCWMVPFYHCCIAKSPMIWCKIFLLYYLGGENKVAVTLIVQHVHNQLTQVHFKNIQTINMHLSWYSLVLWRFFVAWSIELILPSPFLIFDDFLFVLFFFQRYLSFQIELKYSRVAKPFSYRMYRKFLINTWGQPHLGIAVHSIFFLQGWYLLRVCFSERIQVEV